MEISKEKFNLKRLTITISLVLLTAGLVGFITWYPLENINHKQQKVIDSLETQSGQFSRISKKVDQSQFFVKGANSVVLEATEDATVWSLFPNGNFGSDTTNNVAVENNNSEWSFFYIKFQALNIPANATVNSATVRLTRFDCSGTANPDKFVIGRVTTNWSEDTITWGNKNSYVPSNYADAPCTSGYWDLDATAIVNAWRAGSPNYGFTIYALGSADYIKRSCSSEWANASYRPKLTINYTTPDPTPSPTPSASASASPSSSPSTHPASSPTAPKAVPADQVAVTISNNIAAPTLTEIKVNDNNVAIPSSKELSIKKTDKVFLKGKTPVGYKVMIYIGDLTYEAQVEGDLWTINLDQTNLQQKPIYAQAQKEDKGSTKADLLTIKFLNQDEVNNLTKQSLWDRLTQNYYFLGGLAILLVLLIALLIFLELRYHGLAKLFKKDHSPKKSNSLPDKKEK